MNGDFPTTRFTRIDDRTQPMPRINHHSHGQPTATEERDPLFWRAFTAAVALGILVATGVAYRTGTAWGLLAIVPGSGVLALMVVGARETARRWRR